MDEALQYRMEEEELLRIGTALTATRDLEELLEIIVSAARSLTRADAGSLYIKQGDHLQFTVSQNDTLLARLGPEETAARFRPFPVEIDESSMAGYAAVTGAPLNIPDAYSIPEGVPYSFDSGYDERSGYRTVSVLVVPLLDTEKELVGVLQLINCLDEDGRPREFGPNAERLARSMASQAAVSIRNARLTRDLKSAHLDTIMRLSMAAEYRDMDTAMHIRRMANYSAMLAGEMGMSAHEVELMLYASPMHDVGKLGVPDAILLKPGKLTDEEFKVIESHTTIGARILAGGESELIRASEEIALSHHEKWNGRGYPKGLAGEEIPVTGRICALADVFDALTSVRCYKPAFPMEKALDIIRKDSGTHFDPGVVDAFMSHLDDVERIKAEFQEDPDERMHPDRSGQGDAAEPARGKSEKTG